MCCSPWGHKESDTTEQLNKFGCVLVSVVAPGVFIAACGIFHCDCGLFILVSRLLSSCSMWAKFPPGMWDLKFPDQGSNMSPLHCNEDSEPLDH